MEGEHDTHLPPCQRILARTPAPATGGQRPHLCELCLQLPVPLRVRESAAWCAAFGAGPGAARDAPLIMDFLASLETERGNSPSTRNTRLAAIKSFMHFLEYRTPALLEQIR